MGGEKYIITRTTSGISIQTLYDYSQGSITTGIYIPKNVEGEIIINNEIKTGALSNVTLSVLDEILEYCKSNNNQINEFIKEYYLGYLYILFSSELQDISAYPEDILYKFKQPSFASAIASIYIIGKTGHGLVIQKLDSWNSGEKDGIYLADDQSNESRMDDIFQNYYFELTRDLINYLKSNTGTELFKVIQQKAVITDKAMAEAKAPNANGPEESQLKDIDYNQFGRDKDSITELDPSFENDEKISDIRTRITQTNSKKNNIITFGKECHPIIHNKLIQLIKDFLTHKNTHGSQKEKDFYRNYNAILNNDIELIKKYINRLLFKRPKTFQKSNDECKFKNNSTLIYDGVRRYDNVGKDSEQPHLQNIDNTEQTTLTETMSYDEMEIAAMVSMSWKTPVYNTGSRTNGYEEITEAMIEDKYVIYIGCIGARF